MIIKTQRLIIRDFASEDWVAVHQYASLGDILIYEPWGPNTKEQTIEFIQQAIIDAQEKPRKIYEFAITLASTGLLIGGCGVRIKYHKPDEVNLGYVIHPSYWRKGYATEACVALITFAQEQMSSSRLVATCDEFNIALKGFWKSVE